MYPFTQENVARQIAVSKCFCAKKEQNRALQEVDRFHVFLMERFSCGYRITFATVKASTT